MAWRFYLLEFSIYLPMAFFMFIGNYFNQLHFSDLQNGILGSTSAIILLLSNPIWMRFSDRRVKNGILAFLAFGSAALVWGMLVFQTFWITLAMAFAVGFLWTSVVPIAESISIFHSNELGFSFGRARMMGSIGFSSIMVVFGYLNDNFTYFLMGAAAFAFIGIVSLIVPKTQGFNVGKPKVKFSPKNLSGSFYRMLVLEVLVLSSNTFGLYFLPILMKSRGIPVSYAGIAMSVQAIVEIPFLFFADWFIKKLGVKKILVISSALFGIRWILTYMIHNPMLLISVQALEFFNWITIYYAIWHYVSSTVRPENRSDAQAVFWMVTSGVSMIFGYIMGGWISDRFGIAHGYLIFGIMALCVAAAYGAYEYFHSLKKT